MLDELKMAAKIAYSKVDREFDPRNFWLGCVGFRKDGTLVSARNGAVMASDWKKKHLIPGAHAEIRTARKGANILFVARVSKVEGNLVMARPCGICQCFTRSLKVEKIYYTINENQYGVYHPLSNYDRVHNC